MQLTPSDIYLHFKPSECDLRVYLHEQRVEAAEPSPYSEVLKRLGKRHEKQHLESLGEFEDLSRSEDVETTKASVAARVPVIFQPLLRCTLRIAGVDWSVVGWIFLDSAVGKVSKRGGLIKGHDFPAEAF